MAALPKPFQKMRKGLGKEVQLRSSLLAPSVPTEQDASHLNQWS